MFYKEYRSLLQGKNHINEKNYQHVHVPCYDGWWFSFGGGPCKFHKFYFRCDDLNRCVGGLGRKYVVDRPHVPTICPIQEGPYLIQDKVTMLKEVNFVLVSNSIVFFVIFLTVISTRMHQLLDVDSWPKFCNNKNIQCPQTFKLLKEH